MTDIQKPAYHADVSAWLERRQLSPPASEHPDWGLKLSMSTVPLPDWVATRSKIPPGELWFGATVHRIMGWRATIMTRDERFKLNWSSWHPLAVVSDSFLHRVRTPWPTPSDLDELPMIVPRVEKLLGKRFIRCVDVEAHSLKSADLETIRRWISPICDDITFTLGNIYGPIPNGVEYDDRRSENRVLTIRAKAATPLL